MSFCQMYCDEKLRNAVVVIEATHFFGMIEVKLEIPSNNYKFLCKNEQDNWNVI